MIQARLNGQSVYVGVGKDEEKKITELYIDISKTGSTLRGFASTIAMLASKAIQHGCPVEEVLVILSRLRFPPNGKAALDDEVIECKSVLDLVSKLLRKEL
jgi:hypothetical protein